MKRMRPTSKDDVHPPVNPLLSTLLLGQLQHDVLLTQGSRRVSPGLSRARKDARQVTLRLEMFDERIKRFDVDGRGGAWMGEDHVDVFG